MSDDAVPEIQVEITPELEVGIYANFALVSSSEHDFVIDFCQLPARREEDEPVSVRVVSRIRVAPSFVGPLLQAISQNAFNRDENLRRKQEEAQDGDH